jgi:hypothetical protein
MIMADPPDNIGLGYKTYKDKRPDYLEWLANVIELSVAKSDVFWLSYNAKWTFEVGRIVSELVHKYEGLQAKPCVQIYTFGQHNQHDLGNNHRPLIRITQENVELYPDAIRVPSWRQEHGDKRANPRGRVPGDVAYFEQCPKDTLPLPNWSASDIERFLSHIKKAGDNDCWEWTGGKRAGYGRIRVGGRTGHLYGATRLMWRLVHGTDPVGQLILHTCDNPGCCNPKHLFIGTDDDNNLDKEMKGRGNHPIGTASGLAKLTDEQVRMIYQSPDSSLELSAQYGVTTPAIDQIRQGKTWQHITQDLNLTDVFNFPRVTGNSKQRRKWHPTQLNEGLVERCIKLSCKPYDTVIDPFAGTGTTLRVCKNLGIACTTSDIDHTYCEKIAEENNLQPAITDFWPDGRWYSGKGTGLAHSNL